MLETVLRENTTNTELARIGRNTANSETLYHIYVRRAFWDTLKRIATKLINMAMISGEQ